MEDEEISIDLTTVNNLEIKSQGAVVDNISTSIQICKGCYDAMIAENVSMEGAKLEEMSSWKQNDVYPEVVDSGQNCVSTRWICSLKVTRHKTQSKTGS